MSHRAAFVSVVLCIFSWGHSGCVKAEAADGPAAVVRAKNASFPEKLAAQEIRRYFYVRTNKLLPIVEDLAAAPQGGLIVIGTKSQPPVVDLLHDPQTKTAVEALAPEQYLLKIIQVDTRPIVLVAGGDPIGTLYGAYRVAEHLGVRFYLEGDVIPDQPIDPQLPEVDEVGKPLFDRRGIQPFHDFPEGPDWWNTDAYKAILAQLPKLRMNFFGLHTYPEGGVGPEPLVWIGRDSEIAADGQVRASYPSRHFTSLNGTWGYHATKTSDYRFGAAALFDRDDYGADYMKGMSPWPPSPEAANELFGRMGAVLRDAFTWAKRLGVKTCIGTESPLVIPTLVKERLKAAGSNPADPAVVQAVYEGIFRRIMDTHPLDYYWFWTPEGWTWSAVSDQQIQDTVADFRAALAAAQKVNAPFTLATCGWVLGPPQQPALFDNLLPKQMPMSCINRQVGHSPVEPGFAKVQGRPKWAIPWMEDDPALISPQLWAGRMRKDAADARAYGCTGLLGIHWRTRILGPNVSALAMAAWDQRGWNPDLAEPTRPKPPQPKLPEGPVGGQFARFPNSKTAGTGDQPLYQSVRYNVDAYHLDVPDGKYTVTLKFVEPAYNHKAARSFGVKIQGTQVLERLDIFEKVGKDKAIDFTFKDVEVANGRLTIDFLREIEFPCIAAIQVVGPVQRKINCGGEAYQDYHADWPASAATTVDRFLPASDFYADWALAQFGPEVAEKAAAIFDRIDCRLPRPSDWVNGPGGINPDGRPWDEVAKQYAFVDEFAQLAPQVKGAGSRERFHYWLNNFAYMRANAQVNCTWARFNEAMSKVKAEKDPAAQKRLARELALPIRKELVSAVGKVHHYLLATVTTTGEMGTVTNWQQHLLPDLLLKPGQELAKMLGEELPADALPAKDYQGPPHMIVPVVRTSLLAGEPLELTVLIVGAEARKADLMWRPMGAAKANGAFRAVPLTHVARGVYRVKLADEATKADLEYAIVATIGPAASAGNVNSGQSLCFPATAAGINDGKAAASMCQTVVVVDGQ